MIVGWRLVRVSFRDGNKVEIGVEVAMKARENTSVMSYHFRWLQFDLHRRTGQEGEHRSNHLRQLNSNETHIDCSTIYSRPVPFPFVSFQWSSRSLHSILSLLLFSSLRLILVLSLFQSSLSLHRHCPYHVLGTNRKQYCSHIISTVSLTVLCACTHWLRAEGGAETPGKSQDICGVSVCPCVTAFTFYSFPLFCSLVSSSRA